MAKQKRTKLTVVQDVSLNFEMLWIRGVFEFEKVLNN